MSQEYEPTQSADLSSSSLSPFDLKNIRNYTDREDVTRQLRKIHRSELLPFMFKVRGQPMTLDDHPQFRPMYDSEYVPDTLFMCGRQLGKSLNLSRSEVLDLISVPHLQVLYVAPLQGQTQYYSATYLAEAIRSCEAARRLQIRGARHASPSLPILQSLRHQTFHNGSGIKLTYAKTSSDRARGIYADRIDLDEIQDQLVDNIPIISESLTASKWGIRRFTGTARTTDNTIESLWQQSSQCEWAMCCESCNFWNFPTEDGRVLDMIQADGIHCINCGARLNVRKGEWVPAVPGKMREFRGYHIPQIVVPYIVENPHRWGNIVKKVLSLPLATIMQEMLGISHSLGARVISQKDIERQSSLPSVEELRANLDKYTLTVGGLDWGGAERKSFTVHTIIGIRPDSKIDVLWARRFVGFDPDETLTEIAKAHRYYRCSMLAADYGMGFDKNVMLEQRFGLAVIQIMLVRQNRLFGYSPTLGQHRWTVDKTTALDILFLAIKYGRIFFPPQSEFKLYTDDLLSPYETVTESGGLPVRRFLRNPNRPDDFCMALNFACVLGMRLVNSTMVDLVPQEAFGGGVVPDTSPAIVNVDPADLLTAIQV